MDFVEQKDGKCEIGLGAMIDCVFLLLLYFMVAAQIKPDEKYLGMMACGPTPSPDRVMSPPIELRITGEGYVSFNKETVAGPEDRRLPVLKARLAECIRLFGAKEQRIIIAPEPAVRHQRIVDIMNAAAAAGAKNISFALN